MLYMNSAVNPVLYGLLNPKLRAHYIGILACKDSNKVSWVSIVCFLGGDPEYPEIKGIFTGTEGC